MHTRLLDFQGRLGRKDYFFNFLKFLLVASLFCAGVGTVAILMGKFVSHVLGVLLVIVVGGAYGYASIRFSLSQGAKRAHDLGHSGWAALLLIVPGISFFALLYFMFAPGQAHANGYGERDSG